MLAANKNAFRSYPPLEKLHVVPCEQVLFWRIIYDGGGPEVVIDKITGQVVKIYEIPQGPVNDADAIEPAARGISEQEAIEIAKRNLLAWYGREDDLAWFTVSACELARVWRVIFDIRLTLRPEQGLVDFPSVGTWQYVIDKKTGEILYKQQT